MTRLRKPPKADQAIAAGLSERFRSGQLYSYSYENGTWSTWTTAHDWEATERNGQARCCCAPHLTGDPGPTDWDRSELLSWLGLDVPAPARLSKVQLVAQLRAIAHELPASALALLDAA